MSWNFNHTGTRAAVALKVAGENYVPDSVKKAIADVIAAPIAAGATNGVKVVSWGHVDQHSAGLHLDIEGVNLVLDAPAADPAPPASEAPSPLKT